MSWMRASFWLGKFLLPFLLASRLAAEPGAGVIRGNVTDPQGEPLPGVTITLQQGDTTLQTVWSDATGTFEFTGVTPGNYQLVAQLDGFGQARREVQLTGREPLKLTLVLETAQFAEEVLVQAEKPRSGVVQVLEERRQRPVVSEALSREDMAKTPDSDAASAMQRVTGVSTVGNRYVFVRGLGERYATVLLNGAELPSTETEKRVVPLDLFPTRLLDQVTVLKSYAPDLPGSFGGGLLQLNTQQWPQDTVLTVRVGSGSNSQTRGASFARYAGGLEFDGSGGQPLPRSFPAGFIAPATRFNPSGYTPEQLQTLGRTLATAWRGEGSSSAPPNRSFALSFARTFGPLGVILSATQSHGFTRTEETQTFYGLDSGQMVPINDYQLVTLGEQVRWGIFGSLAWKLATNHSLRLNTLATRNARSSDRTQEGYNSNSGNYIRDLRARYTREDLVTNQLSGEHFFAGIGQGVQVEWQASSGRATNWGDLRENLYGLGSDGIFRLLVGYPEVGKMEFHRLHDTIRTGALAASYFFSASTSVYGSFKVGGSAMERDRRFLARRFKFVTNNARQFDLSLPPELLFQPGNIRPDGFELREVTGVNDSYTGSHSLTAFYAQSDITFGKLRALVGLRLEDSQQEVITTNPFDTRNPEVARLDNRDLLPAVNLTYALSSRTNVRLAASRTVNRPEFRELSPFAFVEITGGRSVVGNPRLRRSLLDAAELRWETFPNPGEVMAASVFFKRILQPIERIIQPTTELRSSWINAKEAELKGVELEYRRSLGIIAPWLSNFQINTNYAFVDSEVEVPAQALSVVTSTHRPLQGQARHVFNWILEYYHPRWETMARVLFNFNGRRLSEVGAYRLPDIYEEDSGTWDVLIRQHLRRLLPGLEVTLAGTNITNEKEKFVQGQQVQRLVKPGRTWNLTLGYAW